MDLACPSCACPALHPAHAVLLALGDDDVDAALEAGLLATGPCPDCAAACAACLHHASESVRSALAARARHRARGLRLARRKREREAARAVPPTTAAKAPPLPAAAADALARALARAAARKP